MMKLKFQSLAFLTINKEKFSDKKHYLKMLFLLRFTPTRFCSAIQIEMWKPKSFMDLG